MKLLGLSAIQCSLWFVAAVCLGPARPSPAEDVSYTYDAVGRLIGVDHGGGKVIAYGYDGRGNLVVRDASPANGNAAADLAVSVSDSIDPLTGGNSVIYAVTVSNSGPDTATGVVVTNALPRGIPRVSIGFSQGDVLFAADRLVWTVGVLASNATACLELGIRPLYAQTVTNTATVHAGESDPDPADNSDVEATTVRAAPDTDGDQLPDWWELAHFADGTTAGAGVDSDGDGRSNLLEYLADTNPLDAASRLIVSNAGRRAGGFVLTFDASPSRRYDIQSCADLVTDVWRVVVGDIAPTGTFVSAIEALDGGRRLFRVQAKLP